MGSGAITPICPEDYALLGYGAAKTVGNIAKSRADNGVAKASRDIIPQEYRTKIDNKVKIVQKDESLPSFVKDSFKDGIYRTVVTNEDIVVYRVYGGNAKAEGSFVTTSPANNKIQAKIDAALLPEWKNTRQFEAEIIIPKGTTINVGRVEEQIIRESGTVLKGDADQILMPKDWPSSWIKSTRKVKP